MAGNKKNKHIIELLILFIGMPAVVLVPIHSGIRAAIILVAVVYAIYMSRKDRIVQTKALYAIPEYTYWKVILMRTALAHWLNRCIHVFLSSRESLHCGKKEHWDVSRDQFVL